MGCGLGCAGLRSQGANSRRGTGQSRRRENHQTARGSAGPDTGTYRENPGHASNRAQGPKSPAPVDRGRRGDRQGVVPEPVGGPGQRVSHVPCEYRRGYGDRRCGREDPGETVQGNHRSIRGVSVVQRPQPGLCLGPAFHGKNRGDALHPNAREPVSPVHGKECVIGRDQSLGDYHRQATHCPRREGHL